MANMKKTRFYFCGKCGNIIASTNNVILNCCGQKLTELKAEELKNDKGGLKTMCDVLDRIEEKGIKTGEVTMAYVALKLVNAGRGNDLERAVRDDDFRNKLIEEFGEKI